MADNAEQRALRAKRWLKNTKDGSIYLYCDILNDNPRTIEVSAEEAFPEKFIPVAQKGRKSKVDLGDDMGEDVKAPAKPELNADATRGVK